MTDRHVSRRFLISWKSCAGRHPHSGFSREETRPAHQSISKPGELLSSQWRAFTAQAQNSLKEMPAMELTALQEIGSNAGRLHQAG